MEENKEKSNDFADYYRGIKMKEIENVLDELTAVIKEQECCVEYQKALAFLKQDKELFKKLNEFRTKNMELRTGHKTLQDQSALYKEYEDFLLKEPVRQFLHWEQETTALFRMIYDRIAQESELDYSFLD